MSVVPLPDVEGGGPLPRPPRSTRRHLVAAFLLLILLALLIIPPYLNLTRFRTRLESSIGGALGRRVTLGSVTLRLLPRPGFNLENFVVYDDPGISAEPMLRADSVAASLRLTSLWRGRLEIASLSLKYPSLNVVRAGDGRWNIEALLARASQLPSAPTARTRAESRPRFPYIEAEGGRINFKLGQEKKVFALSDADFAVWLAREDEWDLRLDARPVRTDFNLSDTGRVRISGTIGRAASFRDTPLKLRFALERAQLGQLTTLVYGRDRGWRGTASLEAFLAGTPAQLQVAVQASVEDFRRYDIQSGGFFALGARCSGQYSVDRESLSQIDCTMPAGDGQITLRGQIVHPFQERAYDLSIAAKDVPMQELVRLAQHAKRDLPPDLDASGDVDAAFVLRSAPTDGAEPQAWTGGGSTREFVLRSRTLGDHLALGDIRFQLQPTLVPAGGRKPVPDYQRLQLTIAPFLVALGGAAPANVRAALTRNQYLVHVSGDTALERLLHVAQGLGIPALLRQATGTARIDVDITGGWSGFAAPLVVGNLQLKNAATELPGLAAELRVSTAAVSLAPDGVAINDLSASLADTRIAFDGSLSFPRRCDLAAGCLVQFDLRSDQLSTDDLNRVLNPQLRSRPWYEFVSGRAGREATALARLRAQGRVNVGRLLLKSVTATRVSAQVKLADSRLVLADLRGDLFGGHHQGNWQADFTGNMPSYSGTGAVEGVSLAQVSAAMRDSWAAGTLRANYQAHLAGWNASDLLESLTGSLDFQWRDGVLRHLALRGAEPLRFSRFQAHAVLTDGTFLFSDSRMEASSGIYEVSGTVSLTRQLALKLTARNGVAIAVGGSLQKPRVTLEKSAAEAALKP